MGRPLDVYMVGAIEVCGMDGHQETVHGVVLRGSLQDPEPIRQAAAMLYQPVELRAAGATDDDNDANDLERARVLAGQLGLGHLDVPAAMAELNRIALRAQDAAAAAERERRESVAALSRVADLVTERWPDADDPSSPVAPRLDDVLRAGLAALERKRDAARAEAARLRSGLGEVVASFSEVGHIGASGECWRSGWVQVERVNAWWELVCGEVDRG